MIPTGGDRPAQDQRAPDDDSNMVDEASKESFPASDPPAWNGGHAQDDALTPGNKSGEPAPGPASKPS